MKYYKALATVAGILVLVLVTAGVTMWIENSRERKHIRKESSFLNKVLGKDNPRDLMKTIKLVKTLEVLNLEEEQMAFFITQWNKMDEVRQNHMKEQKEKVDKLGQLIKNNASEEELEEAVESIREQEDRIRNEMDEYKEQIDELLTPEQQAKFILFQHKFRQQMRNQLRRPRHSYKQDRKHEGLGKRGRNRSRNREKPRKRDKDPVYET